MTLFTGLLVTAMAVFAFPPAGDPQDADLIYVIGPPTALRISSAESLQEDDPSRTLLVSVSSATTLTKGTAAKLAVCSRAKVVCQHPEPFTTKGEALMLVDYARTHEVHKVAVITFTPHVARTRYIFARCAPDIDVQVIGVDEHLSIGDWVYQFAYQTTAFVKAAATPCASDDE
ncbi:YdcF family protein [Microbacterium neimengense]